MAASILQRCLIPVQTFSKCVSHRSIVRRCLLSTAYTDATLWDQRQKDPQNIAQLASLMDRTYERKFPVSSLTMARFIDNISSREEVDQAEYYLYKFRHSPNCWYLRDWTIHSWFRHCLRYGAREKALYFLKNKVQFGMFPDEFTFNLLIDSFVKDEDFKGACSVVEEVMLQESFEKISTQIVCLYALSRYLNTKPELSWQEERNIGASLLLAGLKQENSVGFSARLLGCALIGNVELSRGIHSVFHQMPLIWTSGYLGRALVVMETVCSEVTDVKLSKEVLDQMEKILEDLSASQEDSSDSESDDEVLFDEHDGEEREKLPQYIQRFKELRKQLEVQDKTDERSLESLTSVLSQHTLSRCEELDISEYRARLVHWETERQQLIQRETDMKHNAQREKEMRQSAGAAQ
ncbi:28S ribosomal protein S27, mitochondrial [Triplophysa tibetana]|uniref:Small ribosomal subunit protein mS27 n=1 Tax=Triplophysa tibetana TaxID=1572043 RepID=A0A5A9P1D7_9TELE|nr:28S ribosomal protein S27, mitochondrial [Triplophysa tibetana]